MSSHRVVVYKSPGEVEVESIDYPRLEVPREVADHFGITQKAPHAAILKVTTTNICGSDQHMVRGRTTAPVGQSPVKQYNRKLMNLILHDKAQIAKAVSATTISLDEAPQGYQQFDSGVAQKFVIDPHGMVEA